MHDSETGVQNPNFFTSNGEMFLEPKKVAPKIQNAIADRVTELHNQGRTNVKIIDGVNKLLVDSNAQETNKKHSIRLDPEVQYFVTTFNDVLSDLSDELAATNEQVGKEKSIEARTDHALINQRFSQAFYSAAVSPSGDIQRRNATLFVKTMRELQDTGLGALANTEINNARAQTAVMLSLEKAGYKIIVPDPEDYDEVREMDVLALADLVAISPEGQVNFVDVKGTLFAQNGEFSDHVSSKPARINENDKYASDRKQAVSNVLKKISAIGYDMGYNNMPNCVEVTVPTERAQISELGEVKNPLIAMDIIRALER